MGSKRPILRGLVAAFIAVAFILAAQPGAMAMPPAQPTNTMSMASTPASARNQADQQSKQNSPCKDMSFCLGMLSCYGMAVVAVDYPAPMQVARFNFTPHFEQMPSSLTHAPENPPPIA
jgi:hypothetical protein